MLSYEEMEEWEDDWVYCVECGLELPQEECCNGNTEECFYYRAKGEKN